MKEIHKNDYDIILYAIEIAKKSNMEHKHGCVIIDNKGNIISSGYNKFLNVSPDKIKIFDKNTSIKISKHAEEIALKKADPKKLFGAKLYIVRWGKVSTNPLFMYSKPCKRCTSIIETCMKKCGLKAVYYT